MRKLVAKSLWLDCGPSDEPGSFALVYGWHIPIDYRMIAERIDRSTLIVNSTRYKEMLQNIRCTLHLRFDLHWHCEERTLARIAMKWPFISVKAHHGYQAGHSSTKPQAC